MPDHTLYVSIHPNRQRQCLEIVDENDNDACCMAVRVGDTVQWCGTSGVTNLGVRFAHEHPFNRHPDPEPGNPVCTKVVTVQSLWHGRFKYKLTARDSTGTVSEDPQIFIDESLGGPKFITRSLLLLAVPTALLLAAYFLTRDNRRSTTPLPADGAQDVSLR